MITTKRNTIRRPANPLLTDGQHQVSVQMIQEQPEHVVVKFRGESGFINLIVRETPLKILSGIAYCGGLKEGFEFKLSSLIGLRMNIKVEYNQVIAILP